jgi:hypothetical protein
MQMRRGEGTHKFLGMTVGHEVEETFGWLSLARGMEETLWEEDHRGLSMSMAVRKSAWYLKGYLKQRSWFYLI